MSALLITTSVMVACLCWAGHLSAATVSPGDDLQAVVSRLRAGDTLILRSGTYELPSGGDGPILIIPSEASGEPGARTRIGVDDGATVVIKASVALADRVGHVTIDGLNGTLIFEGDIDKPMSFSSGTSDDIRYERFEMRWFAQGFTGGWNNSVFKDLHIHHFGLEPDGDKSLGCLHNVAESQCHEEGRSGPGGGCVVTGHCHAFYFQGDSHDNLIEGAHVHDGEGWGVHVYGSRTTVRHSSFHDLYGHGIGTGWHTHLRAEDNVSCRNGTGAQIGNAGNVLARNTFIANRTYGISVVDGDAVLEQNIVLDNHEGAIATGAAQVTASQNVTTGAPGARAAGDLCAQGAGGPSQGPPPSMPPPVGGTLQPPTNLRLGQR